MNLSVLAGESLRFDVAISDPRDSEFDLSTCTFLVRVTSRAGVTLLELTENSGIVRANQSLAVALSAEQTAALGAGSYRYSLIIETPQGHVDVPSGDGTGAIVVTGLLPGPVAA